MKLSPEMRSTTVESLVQMLSGEYAFPGSGQEMADRTRGQVPNRLLWVAERSLGEACSGCLPSR